MRYCRTHDEDYFASCSGCEARKLARKHAKMLAAPIGEAIKQSNAAFADKIAKIQEAVRAIREDFRNGATQTHGTVTSLDSRLNKIEAELGTLVSEARDE